MNQGDLVAKLHAMRSSAGKGDVDAMTHLFGTIFDREIADCGSNQNRIAIGYQQVHGGGRIEGAIGDGRKLARFVTVKPEVARRWRG